MVICDDGLRPTFQITITIFEYQRYIFGNVPAPVGVTVHHFFVFMTSFSMFLSFAMLIVGGYGFSSTKVASLNIPLMEKIAPTVHSWAFTNPLLCGIILFVYAVFSVSDKYHFKVLQGTLAAMTLLLLFDAPSLVNCILAFSNGGRPSLEALLQGESGIAAALFLVPGIRKLRALMRKQQNEKPHNAVGVSES